MFKKTNRDGIKEDIKDLIRIKTPSLGHTLIYLKNRNFSIYEMILNIHINEKIENIIILSYWINSKTSNKIHEICHNVKMIVANNFKLASRGAFKHFENKDLKLKDLHAKMCLIKTKKNNYIMSSSANVGTIDNLDFTTITNNKNLYKKLCQAVTKI